MKKNSSNKVSIIVPIYNVEQYLPKCLDSLINQTFKDIEIWAISDGSPDNSVDIIKEYSKKDYRVKCIEKENGGYGSVLEYAIKNIETEYFLICDPDDWLREDAIELLYKAAVENNLDFVRGAYNIVYSNDGEERFESGASFKNVFDPKPNIVYDSEVQKFWLMTVSPHSKLYKTKLAQGIEFPHKVSFTDTLLFNLYMPKVRRAMYIDEALSYYLIDREGNSVTDAKPKIADDHYKVFMSMAHQYEKYPNKSPYFYYRMFLQYIYANFEIGKIKNKEDYLEKRELMYEMLKYCIDNKKQILPLIGHETLKKKIDYKLLLNKKFSRKMFEMHSKNIWKYFHGEDL